MARQVQYRRLIAMLVLLLAAFAGLGYRLVDLQVLRHSELSAKAEQNTHREFFFEPRRGDILDVNGNILATSVSAKTVCANPSLMNDRQAAVVARALAPLLQMSESEILEKLARRVRVDSKGETNAIQYVRLKRYVPAETWQRIASTMSNLTFGVDERKLPKAEQLSYRALRQAGVFSENFPIRVYPNQRLAAHVLGCAQTEDVAVNNSLIHEVVGKDGVELTLNSKLSGVPGWRLTETDRRGRELVSWREQDVEPRDGLNAVLTIDAVIQHIVEAALAQAMQKHRPHSITGIVVRPRTGEILALAMLPNFDPNDYGGAPPDARRDRVVSEMIEPGSTFKIVVISGALNDGIVHLNDYFDCEHGHFAFAGRVLHDAEPHGVLSVESILTKSSNIGAAKVGIRMGPYRLYDYMARFGFGQRTGVALPGEISCRDFVRLPKDWSKVTIAQIPMGQGVGVTRLQMLMAMCAIADGGRLMQPMLVDRLEDSSGNTVVKYSPQPVRQVVSEPTARLMVEALKTVVTPEGTAPGAAMTNYVVAGKTGTAEKVEHGVYVRKYVASFIGFFPADDPQLCISIVMDEPKEGYYGGLVCGPVFRQIAQQCASYLNIPPDVMPPGPEPARPVMASARERDYAKRP